MSGLTEIPVGRLLRANATSFTLGCRIGGTDKVSFGSLVRAGSRAGQLEIYGLVYDITIVDDLLVKQLAISPGMTEEQRHDQLERRQVPIEMSVLAIGFREGDLIQRRVPPRPPLSLDRVSLCSAEEVRTVTDRLGYLRLVLRQRIGEIPVEQLIVAHIALTYQARGRDSEWTLKAAGELIAQLRDDYAVLLPLLEALGDAVPQLEGVING
jgi:hypothetical protein